MALPFSYTDISFSKSGNGAGVLVAFHGIGQYGAECFSPFTEKLGHQYVIYAIDIPFHGKNNTKNSLINDEFLSKEEWKIAFERFLKQNNIKAFDIVGFSIGGRFALATLEAFAGQIEKAYLIAPDGVSEQLGYKFATNYKLPRKIFRAIMERPTFFLSVLRFLNAANILETSLFKFTELMIGNRERRITLYNSWVYFRNLSYNIPALWSAPEIRPIAIYLFFGEFDTLLKEKHIQKLKPYIQPDRYIQLPVGHTNIVEKVSQILSQTQNMDPD